MQDRRRQIGPQHRQLALLVVRFRFLELGLLPYAALFSSIPIVALAPVIVKAVGLDWPSKTLVVAMTVLFPVVVGAVRGLQSADRMHLDLMHTYSASSAQTFRLLRFPASLPYLFTALKVAATAALVGSIVAEISTISFSGLGKMLAENSRASDTIALWVIMVYGALLGVALVGLIGLAERILTPWKARA